MNARILLLAAVLFVQDDPIATLKSLSPEKAADAKSLLAKGLEQEMKTALKALEESRFDECETHLLRAAHLARPYSPEYAQRAVNVALGLRQEIRAEGAALVKSVADLLRANQLDAATKRLDDATMLAKTWKADLDKLRAWIKTPPAQPAVDAEIARWRTIRPPSSKLPCSTCSGGGEIDCASCVNGLVAQSCRTCAGKGQPSCSLCEGKGTLVHGGYKGTLVLTLEKDVTIPWVTAKGKNVSMRLNAQTILWAVGPCGGRGNFALDASSTPKDSMKQAAPPTHVQIDCDDFYKQLRAFVFNGKAKLAEGGMNGGPKELAIEQARRTFSEYDKCKQGRVPCDRCDGKLTMTCQPCAGKGMRLAPCSECSGNITKACGACGMSGDSAWLATLVPPESVSDLKTVLANHAAEIAKWQERRGQQVGRRAQLIARYEEIRRTLDAAAKIETDYVNLPCGACQGRGGSCESCWGTGRREYLEGTPQFDKYMSAKKLAAQIAELALALRTVPPSLQFRSDDVAMGWTPPKRDPAPPPAPPPPPPPPSPTPTATPAPAPPRSVGSGVGGTMAGLPADLQEIVKKGNAAFDEGKAHLEKAKATQDNDTWKAESKLAITKLREAQSCYTTVQEALDERNIDVPRDLLESIRNMMQALVMARKQAP